MGNYPLAMVKRFCEYLQMVDDWRPRLNELLEENDLNMKEVSLQAGLGETFVRDILKRGREPSASNLIAVELAAHELIAAKSPQPFRRPPEFRPAEIELPPRNMLPKDVPVLGTAAGAAINRGAFRITSEPVDYVLRPPGLLTAKGIYGLYVEGDSMSPKYEPGELIYVNPFRPVAIGDIVVIQEPVPGEELEFNGFIKRLARRTAEWVETTQYNPSQNVNFKNSKGLRLHKVLTTADLFGV